MKVGDLVRYSPRPGTLDSLFLDYGIIISLVDKYFGVEILFPDDIIWADSMQLECIDENR